MNCEDFKKQYGTYLDGRSDATVSEAVERHLEACPSCAGYAEAFLSELKGLTPLLPKWRVTDTAWERLVVRAASSRAFRFGFLWTFARAAAVAGLVAAAALFTYRALTPAWESAAAEKTLTLSPKTKVLLSAGTQYRLRHDKKKAVLVLKMNRGEAVLGIERDVFREAAVELPAARVRVTGTFFLVKTVGAFDFIVEVLEGSVRIEAEGKALRLESGKSAGQAEGAARGQPAFP